MLKKIKTKTGIGKKFLILLLVASCCSFGGCKGQASDGTSADEIQTSVASSDEIRTSQGTGSNADPSEKTTEKISEQNTKPPKNEQTATSADLYCEEITLFSGVYVENGKNEKVDNVAAILVHNRAEAFLDRATITYKYGSKNVTFVVTGLPAGEKCWVMEKSKMQIDGKHKFEFVKCISAFNYDVIEKPKHITTMTKDNVITVTNNSKQTLENVCVYYKNTFEDGNYFGGITYVLTFGKLSPGETIQKESAHFSEDSDIVKYSYQI